MAMKPILFNTEMVRAILDGRKTVTRRVVKGIPSEYSFCGMEMNPAKIAVHADGEMYPKTVEGLYACFEYEDFPMVKTPYQPGDVLWVKETFQKVRTGQGLWKWEYKADCEDERFFSDGFKATWRPSVQMPYEAARIFLRVTNVRVERLQDIMERGERSAKAEGYINDIDRINGTGKCATRHFSEAWDSTVKPKDHDLYGWEANPWVWVISFERINQDEVSSDG